MSAPCESCGHLRASHDNRGQCRAIVWTGSCPCRCYFPPPESIVIDGMEIDARVDEPLRVAVRYHDKEVSE